MLDHQKILDTITQSLTDLSSARRAFKYKEETTEELLALDFLPLQEVVDRVTGERARVLAGTRKTIIEFPGPPAP